MRYRELSPTGDYSFGQSSANFLANSPACVAQAIKTRLNLLEGEWYLDLTEGTPWQTQVLGANTSSTRDLVIRERILGTDGVLRIEEYSSDLDTTTRKFKVAATVSTIYGSVSFAQTTQLDTGTVHFEIGGYGEGGYGRNPYGS